MLVAAGGGAALRDWHNQACINRSQDKVRSEGAVRTRDFRG